MRLAFGIVIPIALASLAYALASISNQLLYVGPFDREAFSWVVVVPIWLSAPVAAGVVWGQLNAPGAKVAAVVVGISVSAVAAWLFWAAASAPIDCEFGRQPATDLVLGSLLAGSVIGAGLSANGLLVSAIVRAGHPWRAAAIGAAAGFGPPVAAFLLIFVATYGQGCRPSPV